MCERSYISAMARSVPGGSLGRAAGRSIKRSTKRSTGTPGAPEWRGLSGIFRGRFHGSTVADFTVVPWQISR
jgi:hypothetical protein